MEIVLPVLIGMAATWYFAWLYYAKAGRELKEEAAKLRDLIVGPLNSLLENEAETRLLLKRAFDEVEKVDPERARPLGEAISKRQNDVAQVVQRAASVLSSTQIETTTKCYQCGRAAHPAGFAGGPGGGWVMWYQCPEHGRFPGGHVDDMYDD